MHGTNLKTRYPLYMGLGGPQGRSGRAEDLTPTGIRSRTVQPIVNRYTDWATAPLPLANKTKSNASSVTSVRIEARYIKKNS